MSRYVRSELTPHHRPNLHPMSECFLSCSKKFEPTRIGYREQSIVRIPADEQIQNSSSTVAYDHSPKKW